MARFVIDEPLPRSAANAIREAGHEAIDIRDIGLRGASDDEIWNYARQHEAVLVTADVEFADMRRLNQGGAPGIVLVRMPSASAPALAAELAGALSGLSEGDLAGSVVVIEPGRVRIRRARP